MGFITDRGLFLTNTPGIRQGSLLGSHERDESRGTVSMAEAPFLDTVWFVGFVCPPCLRSGTKCNYEGITLFSSGVDPYQPDPGILVTPGDLASWSNLYPNSLEEITIPSSPAYPAVSSQYCEPLSCPEG